MSVSKSCLLVGSLSILALSLLSTAPAWAQRVSARDQAAIEGLNTRMAAAEKRYRDGLRLVANSDVKGKAETDAALEDMEDVLDACYKQRGCQAHTLLATYKRLLKDTVDANDDGMGDEGEDVSVDPFDDGSDHTQAGAQAAPQIPEAERAAYLLNDQRHAFDKMVEYNPAVQAGIRRWLTDMRPALITSYENYQNMRAEMYPDWERSKLPEALLFGIMAKESNGRVHATSRAGAAGPLQFMYHTGRRFGLGPDGTGFDTRYDPGSAGEASAAYMNERMRELNNNIEFALAAYNGGEGRAGRVYRQYPGRSFWDDVVYAQFPGETRDYVPMVIAAAWLFLHPKQYGLEFPKVNVQPATLRLSRDSSIYELTICLGNGGTRDGFMRTLRNLNPRYEAEAWISAGTSLRANNKIVALYNRYCVSGPRADLARTLVRADPNAAIKRSALPGVVAVGDVTPVEGVPTTVATGDPKPAQPKAKQARDYRVAKGDTLGRISQRYQCDLKQLAKSNGIKGPAYNVKPGQQITLTSCRK
ncbi:transglycosylase SLT domain-containing protein [Pseudoxanthomonas indica]|uniref:Membrane-bound lytic murein transglycosylase D n=1 Tax=Pseudoxanthomonas indica TaxID=428993 RepID=A0A1T5J0Z2_9GAMM|nr:transglycosylase SLT domain-containing protein [Pseudoxanthomonas indica]SKC44863.1 membrane-bound lytic murein transglycosylase D [Pseudoxanthomonas indica]